MSLLLDDRCCGTKIRLSVFQAAVIRSGNWRPPRAYGVSQGAMCGGRLPPDNPDYTDRHKQYNPSFFLPKAPFRVFVVNNAKSTIKDFFM